MQRQNRRPVVKPSLHSGSNETGSMVLSVNQCRSCLSSFVSLQTWMDFSHKFHGGEADCALSLRHGYALFRHFAPAFSARFSDAVNSNRP